MTRIIDSMAVNFTIPTRHIVFVSHRRLLHMEQLRWPALLLLCLSCRWGELVPNAFRLFHIFILDIPFLKQNPVEHCRTSITSMEFDTSFVCEYKICLDEPLFSANKKMVGSPYVILIGMLIAVPLVRSMSLIFSTINVVILVCPSSSCRRRAYTLLLSFKRQNIVGFCFCLV